MAKVKPQLFSHHCRDEDFVAGQELYRARIHKLEKHLEDAGEDISLTEARGDRFQGLLEYIAEDLTKPREKQDPNLTDHISKALEQYGYPIVKKFDPSAPF